MPLDGIVSDCLAHELNKKLAGGRIVKIFQPGQDEIILHVLSRGATFKLLISANPACPRIHLGGASRENPYNPPVFCMLLRKHLSGSKILGIGINDFERIFTIDVESVNEMGEISIKKIIIEIMGRHSNIILVNENGKIIDSIRHVDSGMSRVREVMPAREYVMPPSQDKTSPAELDIESFIKNAKLSGGNMSMEKYLLNNIKGFSPFLCRNICLVAGIDDGTRVGDVIADESLVARLKDVLCRVIGAIKKRDYKPFMVKQGYDSPGFANQENRHPGFEEDYLHGLADASRENRSRGFAAGFVVTGNTVDFHCLPVWQDSGDLRIKFFDSMSLVLDRFYSERDFWEKFGQKKSSLEKVINANLERCVKKLAIQQEVLREAADMDKLRLYGELITAYIHSVPAKAKKVSLPNYYSPEGKLVEIELDENRSPQENAQIYFKRYNKAKSTYHNTVKQVEDTRGEIDYLESVLHLLGNCSSLEDIEEIREELVEQGYITASSRKDHPGRKKTGELPGAFFRPYKFRSSDGFDIYVGKNNKQNDFLTFKFAGQEDVWLHVKNIPGSHTIIKSKKREVPDATLVEAANIAAWHSKASRSSNVPVDYTLTKHVKKMSGAKPGMVIYENYKTLFVTPDENLVKRLKIE